MSSTGSIKGNKSKLQQYILQCKTEILQCKTEILQSKTEILQCKKEILQCKTEILQCKTEILQCKPEILQCKTEILQCKTKILQCKTEILQCITEILHCKTEILQNGTVHQINYPFLLIFQWNVQKMKTGQNIRAWPVNSNKPSCLHYNIDRALLVCHSLMSTKPITLVIIKKKQ